VEILDIIIWKWISRKEGQYDKGKILDQKLEQLAYAYNGDSPSGSWYCILVH
jgi:hypothetical protein